MNAAPIRPQHRYVVVKDRRRLEANTGTSLYGVEDRTDGSARWVVWDLNGRHGPEPTL